MPLGVTLLVSVTCCGGDVTVAALEVVLAAMGVALAALEVSLAAVDVGLEAVEAVVVLKGVGLVSNFDALASIDLRNFSLISCSLFLCL